MTMELPLFPLNLVLFPGMPLNLHIFEDRYKVMINECIDQRKPFGVVLIANDEQDSSRRAEPHAVGCTAQITQVQPLSQGRMNIAVVGKDRFNVVSLNYQKPYLSGEVENFPLMTDLGEESKLQAGYLRHRLERYLKALQQARQVQFDAAYLPKDPTALAYLSAVLLQVEPPEKQSFLAAERLDELIHRLLNAYRREVTLLEALLSPPDNIDFNGIFSLN